MCDYDRRESRYFEIIVVSLYSTSANRLRKQNELKVVVLQDFPQLEMASSISAISQGS